jgi:hypothetical protein
LGKAPRGATPKHYAVPFVIAEAMEALETAALE